MSYSLSPWLKPRFFITGTNRPLAGGLMYTYLAGTTTNATTYSDDAGTPNTNPIVLNSDGECDLYLDDSVSYRIILKNAEGVTQFDKDRVASLGATQVQSFDNIAALRLRSGTTQANAAETLGYYSAGDGGGNSFYWSSTSTATDNGGTVIKPTSVSGAGRWLAVDTSVIKLTQFGAKGDGIADDTVAISAAMSTEKPLDFQSLTYKITSSIAKTYNSNVVWFGKNATIYNAAASHIEYMIRITANNLNIEIDGVNFDANYLANKALDILATGVTDMGAAGELKISNLTVKKVKRIAALSHGDGIRAQGGFRHAIFNDVNIDDMRLASGAGTLGVVGIAGITVFGNNANAYPLRMTMRGGKVNKVWSEDLAYQYDQDGIRFFGPHVATAGAVVTNTCEVDGVDFKNCYGRSVKSQSFSSVITNCTFERNEGLSTNIGNGEISLQIGSGLVDGCTFIYRNGQSPDHCVGHVGSTTTGSRSGIVFKNSQIYTFATTIGAGLQTFPNSLNVGECIVDNVKCFGTWTCALDALVNGDTLNYFDVRNTFSTEIALGFMSERVLVYVRASGGTSPYSATVSIEGNVYGGANSAYVSRGSVSGSGATAHVSAVGNIGFVNDRTVFPSASPLLANQFPRLGGFLKAGTGNSGSFELDTLTIAAGETVLVPIRKSAGALVFMQAAIANTYYVIFGAGATTNISISTGAGFGLGNAADPGVGDIRVWASGTNELSVSNTTGATRYVSYVALIGL